VKLVRTSITLLVAGSILFAVSCASPNEPEPDPLIGNWMWDESCGGFGGWCYYADSVDYVEILHFGLFNRYSISRDGSIIEQGRYTITHETIWNGASADLVKLQFRDIPMIIETVTSDSLRLTDYCYDCYTHLYHRISPI
jgi:hypothetical protein